MDVHSKPSITDSDPSGGGVDLSLVERDEVAIVVDHDDDCEKRNRSLESVGSSSFTATSASEQPACGGGGGGAQRRRFSNLSNLAQSLPSTTLSNASTTAPSGFSASATAVGGGGSLDHIGVRQRRGNAKRGGSHRNSRIKTSAESESTKVSSTSSVRRTRSALETSSMGVPPAPEEMELVAGDCDSQSEEGGSKSPLLVSKKEDDNGSNMHRETYGAHNI